MNRDETALIMATLSAAYPSFYRNASEYDAQAALNLWATLFEDEPYKLVEAAVMQYIATDEKGYPPHLGAIKNSVYKLRTQDADMSEMEAWNIVKNAMRGASLSPTSRRFIAGVLEEKTSAERNFEAMPIILQRIVGSSYQLAAWADVPSQDVETVVQSNFMRSYRARIQHERERMLMPSSVREMVQGLLDSAETAALKAPEGIEA